MSGLQARIIVASDLSLVAETVRTALSTRGYDCPAVSWPSTRLAGAAGGLFISELVPDSRLCEVRKVLARSRHSWLLLTGAPPGPLWGAALTGGIVGVVPNSADLTEVDAALRQLLAGEPLHDPEEREHWISEWREWQAKKLALARQVASLTPRERAVTRLMYSGKGVREISEELEVSEATVRSHVKAVLRKFRVNSQLHAVAALALLREDPASLTC